MFEYFIMCYGDQLFLMLLCAIAGTIGSGIKRLYQRYVDDATKQAVAAAVVKFVEQVWKDIHGEDKLRKALETAQELLAKKGIDFDAAEMKVYIEAAVAEFNEAFKKPVKAENTAAAKLGGATSYEDIDSCGLLD